MPFAVKRPVDVQVEFATTDGELLSLEGPVRYSIGDALLTGAEGERWPVKRERFDKSYAPAIGVVAGEPGSYRKLPVRVTVSQIKEEMRVETVHGILHGRPGDWLVMDDSGQKWVVANSIFSRDYDLVKGD